MQKNEAIRKIATEHPELWELVRTGQISYREAKKRAGLDTPAKRSAVAPHSVEVGTIYRASWGYDQTNIDYYEVVKTTPKMIELRPIAAERTPGEAYASEWVEPIPGRYTGPALRRRVLAGSRDAVGINSFIIAQPWNGQPSTATSYA